MKGQVDARGAARPHSVNDKEDAPNNRRFAATRFLWLTVSLLVVVSAAIGLLDPSIYAAVMPESKMPGVFAQDAVVLVAAIALVVLALLGTLSRLRVRAVGNGILGLFFYAYGIYAMERVYTWLYPVYLAILGMSLYALAYGIATASADARGKLRVAAPPRVAGAVFGIVIAVMFNVIWFSQLVPLLRAGDRIDYLYSIYVIDLSFVMPAFVIAAVLSLRRHPTGLLGLPGLFVLGAGILSPLALAELVKPGRYGMERNAGELSLYLILSILFAAFTVLHLVSTKVEGE